MSFKTVTTGAWMSQRIREDEIEKYLDRGRDFINDEEIERLLREAAAPDRQQLRAILDKSLSI